MKKNFKQLVLDSLMDDSRLWIKRSNQPLEFNKIQLLDLLAKNDDRVIGALLKNDIVRRRFFVDTKHGYIFKKEDFIFFIEENKVNDSYTRFKNKIGLTASNKFIKEGSDVVLSYPFKDCVLQGCQDKEDSRHNDEVFFNQIIAHDEIDRLFEPKALVNWRRYDKDGEQPL